MDEYQVLYHKYIDDVIFRFYDVTQFSQLKKESTWCDTTTDSYLEETLSVFEELSDIILATSLFFFRELVTNSSQLSINGFLRFSVFLFFGVCFSDNREKWRKRSCFRVFFYVSSLIWAIRLTFLFSRTQVRHEARHERARAKQLVVDSRDSVRRPSLRDAYDDSFGDSSCRD